jgi:hypothetical protein
MDDSALVSRDAALLQRAQSIAAQPSYLLIFFIAIVMVLAAILAVLAGGLAAFVMVGVLVALGAIAKFTPMGENLMVGIVVLIGLIVGGIAVAASVLAVVGA